MHHMPPTKKLTKREPAPPKVNVRRAVTDFLRFDNMAKKFGAQADEVKLLLRDKVLPTQGEADEKGNYWIRFEEEPIEDPDGVEVTAIQAQRRAPKTLNAERAEALLRRKKMWDQCTETITQVVINEDAILAAAFEKRLTEEELESLYDIKVSYAFLPQRNK
jgi:hypothetical protein